MIIEKPIKLKQKKYHGCEYPMNLTNFLAFLKLEQRVIVWRDGKIHLEKNIKSML